MRGLSDTFTPASAWAFSRAQSHLIDEYIVNYEDYVGIGSGAFSYLDGTIYVNTFSLKDYEKVLGEGKMSVWTQLPLRKRERMRYRFMMNLFGLRLDKQEFKRDFGISIEWALWKELAFMRAAGAFSRDDAGTLELTEKGRYLLVVMMREFFIGVNIIRDEARLALSREERVLHFGETELCKARIASQAM